MPKPKRLIPKSNNEINIYKCDDPSSEKPPLHGLKLEEVNNLCKYIQVNFNLRENHPAANKYQKYEYNIFSK